MWKLQKYLSFSPLKDTYFQLTAPLSTLSTCPLKKEKISHYHYINPIYLHPRTLPSSIFPAVTASFLLLHLLLLPVRQWRTCQAGYLVARVPRERLLIPQLPRRYFAEGKLPPPPTLLSRGEGWGGRRESELSEENVSRWFSSVRSD